MADVVQPRKPFTASRPVLSLWRGWIVAPSARTCTAIAESVAAAHSARGPMVTVEDIKGNCKRRVFVFARQEAWAAMRELGKSSSLIARWCGRDPSTIRDGDLKHRRRVGLA